MKLPVKWIVLGLMGVLLAAGVVRTLASRSAAKEALQAQLATQKLQATMELSASDVVRVQRTELSQVLAISGALKAVNSAIVKARAAGEIQGLNAREGDFVRAGQVLGRIDTTEYQARVRQAQQQAEAARAQVNIAQRSLDNNQSLVNQGFISKTALDTSLSNLAGAQATFKAAQAGADLALKSLDDTVLRAPVDGQIAQRLVQNGERVALDAKVLEIVDLRALELEAALSAADSVRVKAGQTATLTIEGLSQPVSARVARINPSTVAGSRSVLVYLSVEATPGLRQGLFAQGTLAIGRVTALALPLETVRTDKPQPYVQTLVDGHVAHQGVTLGASGERQGVAMVEVQGASDGAEVLLGTVGALREGTQVTRTQAAAGKP
ncbi:efflux transporter periplasmic adaptor subunit [Rhodoferax lacus]|uniref:Efflux transporter periplasmic adaptor subunit n=1 Tax=Rhodoferax lacus TaxID=2184758 RepID=A0A3E1RGM0_9BURK|nr:efflux RND transporter periplasmic adaptor subunit [Rhodoferax lacus]RFO98172.1 efflux transporter periplasmic adaptor subunit [Rhodoferax lacus]